MILLFAKGMVVSSASVDVGVDFGDPGVAVATDIYGFGRLFANTAITRCFEGLEMRSKLRLRRVTSCYLAAIVSYVSQRSGIAEQLKTGPQAYRYH